MTRSQAIARVRKYIPEPVMNVIRPLRRSFTRAYFKAKYGFPPPPDGTDLVGYEALIDFMKANRILDLPGDLAEVGAFCGGGTYKLSKFLSSMASAKRVNVIDCFEIEFDQTESTKGIRMAEHYSHQLNGRPQKEVFSKVTQGLQNLEIIQGDSKCAKILAPAICFAFVDGNHAPEYVQNDFYLVWDKLAPGGVVAFHDYGCDLPQVTDALDRLCAQHRDKICNRFINEQKHILYIQKRRA